MHLHLVGLQDQLIAVDVARDSVAGVRLRTVVSFGGCTAAAGVRAGHARTPTAAQPAFHAAKCIDRLRFQRWMMPILYAIHNTHTHNGDYWREGRDLVSCLVIVLQVK